MSLEILSHMAQGRSLRRRFDPLAFAVAILAPLAEGMSS